VPTRTTIFQVRDRAAVTVRPADGSSVEDVLAELQRRMDGGEPTPEQKAAGEQQPPQADPAAPEETELERLRRGERERYEADQAKSIAAEVVARVNAEEQARNERISTIARQAAAEMLGEQGKSLLQYHGGSRYAGPGADESVLHTLAAGGAVQPHTGAPAPQWTPAGAGVAGKTLEPALSSRMDSHREAQAILESKRLGLFLSAVYRNSKGMASDGEREFLFGTKALAENVEASGGFVIPPDWMPDVLALLRGVAVVRRASPRIVPFTRLMNQVQLSTGATAYYTAENAAITTSQESFNQVTLLQPHNLTGLVPVSTYLLQDSIRDVGPNPITQSAEDVIRTDLATVMGLREDRAFLEGAGSAGEPLGLKNIALGTGGANINPITPPANGFQPTLPQLRQIRNFTRKLNVPNPRWVWFFHSSFISYVEQLTDSLGRFLADTSLLQITDVSDPAISYSAGVQGVLDSVPFYASNQIPINLAYGTATNGSYLLLVNMNELVVGLNQDMAVDVSNEAAYTNGSEWISAFQNNQTLFRSVIRHDIAHRYPTQVVLQQGVLVS
jgi:HK97 family phage major capsid protein